jgi:hypothetical protein
VVGKQHDEKIGKPTCKRMNNMQEEKQRDEKAYTPNHDRFKVFDKYCNIYKPIK